MSQPKYSCANPKCRRLARDGSTFCCGLCAASTPRHCVSHWDECELDEQERHGIPRDVHAGHEVRCKACGRWHMVGEQAADAGSKPDAARMRYIRCGNGFYYVGAEGVPYRPEWRRRIRRVS